MRDFVLHGPPDLPGDPIRVVVAGPSEVARWPLLYDAPLAAGGKVCVEVAVLVPYSSFAFVAEVEPSVNATGAGWRFLGRSYGPNRAAGATTLRMTMSPYTTNLGRNRLIIDVKKPAASVKVRAAVTTPGNKVDPSAVRLCR